MTDDERERILNEAWCNIDQADADRAHLSHLAHLHSLQRVTPLQPQDDRDSIVFKKRETLAQPPDWSEWEKWMRGHQLAEREVIFGSVAPTLVAHNTELQALKIEVAVVRDQLDALTKLLQANA